MAIYPKELKSGSQRDHSDVDCSAIHNSQDMETTQVTIDRWLDKEDVVYAMEYYSARKKTKLIPFAITWMDLKGIALREISQTEKDKHHMISLILDYKQTHRQRK